MSTDSAATDITAASPFDLMLIADVHVLHEDYRTAFNYYQKLMSSLRTFGSIQRKPNA